MLKFYRPHGEQLLLSALYLASRGTSAEDVLSVVRNYHCRTGEQTNIVQNARRGVTLPRGGDYWLDPVIKQLFQSLSDDAHGRGESDLIDQIVRVLQLPYGQSILTGDKLRRLRSALLLPSEQAGLTARLRQREMACSQCGLALHDRESVTLVVNDSGQSIVCHRCVAPTAVPCASCVETASLSSKAMNAMSRMQCPTCQEAKAPKKAPPSNEEEIIMPAPPEPERPLWSRTPARTGAVRVVATAPEVVPSTWASLNDSLRGNGG